MNNKKPNIILITADQMRADSIGYINDEVKTPVLKELADNGTVQILFVLLLYVLHQELLFLLEDTL